jgi:TolB protein
MEPTARRSVPSSARPIRRGLVVLVGLVVATGAASSLTSAPQEGVPDIVIGGVTRPRFAVPECVPRTPDERTQQACRTITQVLRNDLRFERLFQFVPDSLVAAVPPLDPDNPDFEDWQGIGARILVVTRASIAAEELTVEVRVYFVDSGQTMLARRYSGRADNPRIFAHQASDDIMTLTQYKGVARTRIAFTSDRDSTRERQSKELYIVDYDGFNPRRVTVNGSINILPAWSPDGTSLAYVSYRRVTPLVFMAHIFEGRSDPNVTGERGGSQAFAPAFSPDGQRLAFASNRAGNMDIWVAGVDGSGAQRVTTTRAKDIAPCWSPTGQEIAFTSDRTGTPQLYVMSSDGLNVRRLTMVGSYNDACAWNPAREFSEIAYTARLEARVFDIAVIDLATQQVRQITRGRATGSCEYPSWAPNGRHLVFSCQQRGTWAITIADREGRSIKRLATGPGDNVQPDWGP